MRASRTTVLGSTPTRRPVEPDAAALVEVLEHGGSLLLGKMAVEQGRALTLGETILAGLAVEQPDVVLFAVTGAD